MSTMLRRFKQSLGCSPKEYQERLRITHACMT
jgi:transcriptional regulator GlxA family with amidase domain